MPLYDIHRLAQATIGVPAVGGGTIAMPVGRVCQTLHETVDLPDIDAVAAHVQALSEADPAAEYQAVARQALILRRDRPPVDAPA